MTKFDLFCPAFKAGVGPADGPSLRNRVPGEWNELPCLSNPRPPLDTEAQRSRFL